MDRSLFLRAQSWLQNVEDRPKTEVGLGLGSCLYLFSGQAKLTFVHALQTLEKLFEGSASFHVSLLENFNKKSSSELKGALAPDALFVKLGCKAGSIELECVVYRTLPVGGEGKQDSEVFIAFEGEMFELDRSKIRFIVTASPKGTHSKSPQKRVGPSDSVSPKKKRQRTSSPQVGSIIFEGITLNLVDKQNSDMGELMKCLKESSGNDNFAKNSFQSSDTDTGTHTVDAALKTWLDSMDKAIELAKSVSKCDAEPLNAFVKTVCEMPALDDSEHIENGNHTAEEDLEVLLENTMDDPKRYQKFLNDIIVSQKQKEAQRYTRLMKTVIPNKS